MFTYAHVKWFYGQSERAYYLNYFIKDICTLLTRCLYSSLCSWIIMTNIDKNNNNNQGKKNKKAIFAVMNTTLAVVKIMPEKFRPLRQRCSTLPTELTSQLGAGHFDGS